MNKTVKKTVTVVSNKVEQYFKKKGDNNRIIKDLCHSDSHVHILSVIFKKDKRIKIFMFL